MVVPDRSHTGNNAIRRMYFVTWITKTTNTHSEYVISTATQVTRKRLNVMFYVHCLCCLFACLFVFCVFSIDEKVVNKTHFYNCRFLYITTGRFILLPK